MADGLNGNYQSVIKTSDINTFEKLVASIGGNRSARTSDGGNKDVYRGRTLENKLFRIMDSQFAEQLSSWKTKCWPPINVSRSLVRSLPHLPRFSNLVLLADV